MEATIGSRPRPVKSRSSACTASMTAGHFPGSGCRNRRSVGYHGLSLRPSNQRQHGSKRSSSQTDLPSAPARWATAVSTEMTRSRLAISAAVSAKSPISPITSVSPNSAGAVGPSFCRLTKCTPGTATKGARSAGAIERLLSSAAPVGECSRELPAQTNPRAAPAGPSRRDALASPPPAPNWDTDRARHAEPPPASRSPAPAAGSASGNAGRTPAGPRRAPPPGQPPPIHASTGPAAAVPPGSRAARAPPPVGRSGRTAWCRRTLARRGSAASGRQPARHAIAVARSHAPPGSYRVSASAIRTSSQPAARSPRASSAIARLLCASA